MRQYGTAKVSAQIRNGHAKSAEAPVVAVVLDEVPQIVSTLLETIEQRWGKPAAVAATRVRETALGRVEKVGTRVRRSHVAVLQHKRIERARRRKGQLMRHRFAQLKQERDTLAEKLKQLSKDIAKV